MKTCSLRTLLALAAVLVMSAPMAPIMAAACADQGPRAIGSITVAELQSLPDGTMVKLNAGRVVSLGALRAEHRARMDRFSRAARLGQTTAAKLTTNTPTAPVASPPTTAIAHPAPGSTTKGGQVKSEPVRANTAVVPKLDVLSSTFVRFRFPDFFGLPMPKDYSDFCKAASPSVCIYLPASTTFTLVIKGSTSFVVDEDPLITDMTICKYDGGLYTASGLSTGIPRCDFYYPVDNVAMFKPSGPLSATESCDPPAKYLLDPKGAVKVSYPYSGSGFTTGGTPVTCVAQVWVGK